MMAYYIGIDGGGSTLRVAIVDDALRVVTSASRGTVNPSAIGREAAAALIGEALREVLALAEVPITAVGIGVAGASAAYAADWLRATIAAVLPHVLTIPSSDNEIALVGAHGAREGAIVLAGTGSVACAANMRGGWAQAGGWGYLLGDEGGGYWLALEALRAYVRWSEGTAPHAAAFAERVRAAFGFASAVEVTPWLYRLPPPTREVAQYANVVLDAAAEGDATAQDIIDRGAAALAAIARAVVARVDPALPIRFCGGLLTAESAISAALCRQLGLAAIPLPLHAPVIGAALLAKLSLNS
jgi:glucosamine kinase